MLKDKYRVVPAFSFGGVDYYQFDTAFDIPAGRALSTLTIYEEFNQRCTHEYLDKHTRAMEILLTGPKINLSTIVQLNSNLKERLSMVQMPDHIYKLASVMFFDRTESPYSYDFEYNARKIESWKKDPKTLDFFLKQPLKDLIPSLRLPQENAKMFFNVAQEVDQLHQSDLEAVLSKAG